MHPGVTRTRMARLTTMSLLCTSQGSTLPHPRWWAPPPPPPPDKTSGTPEHRGEVMQQPLIKSATTTYSWQNWVQCLWINLALITTLLALVDWLPCSSWYWSKMLRNMFRCSQRISFTWNLLKVHIQVDTNDVAQPLSFYPSSQIIYSVPHSRTSRPRPKWLIELSKWLIELLSMI